MEVKELPQGVTRIGRGDGNSILLKSVASSKIHATIECVDSDWVVTDRGSRNGTHVNRVRIDRHRLCHGDVIDFSGTLFEFLSDDSSTGSVSGSIQGPHKITTPIPENIASDDSFLRSIVRTGDLVHSDTPICPPQIDESRVLATLQMNHLPHASWSYNDSARMVSHVLRLTQAITAFHVHQQMDELLRVFLDLFSAASHSLLAIRAELADRCKIVAAISRQEGQPVYLCHPLLRHSMTECEGLLVTDHWRNEPNARPRLTELNRQSLLCVPLPGANGSCQGVLQLQASDSGNPFKASDLERLAVLAHVMSAGVPGIRLSS